MSKATPRPWIEYSDDKHSSCLTNKIKIGSNSNSFSDEEILANKEFIFKAVNCHDELVECLELAHKYVMEHGGAYSVRIGDILRKARGQS
jgi:hypothetical protein